jgi:hypothetical protein
MIVYQTPPSELYDKSTHCEPLCSKLCTSDNFLDIDSLWDETAMIEALKFMGERR